ncbi:MAG: hypothetical protein HY898_08215 [Deltaproteobacteria bacterium]|nr:hypothetical protein [Deltaproteobacteria bacterium]
MENNGSTRELLTIEEFLTLSAKINYQLSASALNKPVLLALVLGPADFDQRDQGVLLGAFEVLREGYADGRRRLGTPGILHPLRTAAILCRTMPKPTLIDVLGALAHDKEEDLIEEELGTERFHSMETRWEKLMAGLDEDTRTRLSQLLHLLSNRTAGTYQKYLVQVLDEARAHPELLHVKLCDRMDNTFDVHLQHPGVTNFNFYRAVFDILFMPRFQGINMGRFHFMPEAREGVMLLSQLFKDTIFLALLRKHGLDRLDSTTEKLFVGLAVSGIREAQWLALELFTACFPEVKKQRELLLSVMEYCVGGGVEAVRTTEAGGILDGMFVASFQAAMTGQQKKMLRSLFENRDQLAKMVLTFIVLFGSFINDPTYTIDGIDREGIRAVDG